MGLTITKSGPYFNGSGQPVPNNQVVHVQQPQTVIKVHQSQELYSIL